MAATAAELMESRKISGSGTNLKQTISYIVTGDDDDAAVYAAVLSASAPTVTVNGTTLTRDDVDLTPEYADEDTGEGIWKAEVRYLTASAITLKESFNVPTPRDEEPAIEKRYQVGGAPTRRLYSLDAQTRFGTDAPDPKGAVEVDEEGVKGAEIEFGTISFTIREQLTAAAFFSARSAYEDLSFKVNSDSFDGYAAGEVLYAGFSADPYYDWDGATRTDYYYVTHTFRVSKNGTPSVHADSLPPGATLTAKLGWIYFWIMRERVNRTGVETNPIGAYYAQVYETASFSGLPS